MCFKRISSKLNLRLSIAAGAAFLTLLTAGESAFAQVPVVLTDKIFKGDGVINLLKDVSSGQLNQYFNSDGTMYLGVDLNEENSGNETRSSVGVAIKQIQLLISTTAGDFTFNDFWTSTTAMILEQGASATQEFHTLFGKSGSSQVNSSTSDFNLGKLDDVIEIRNIAIEGTITRAEVRVTFLKTANTGVEGNETFFDFSNGFEDFALLGRQDAALLESSNFGMADAPGNVSYSISPSLPGPADPPAAPLPPLYVIAALVLLVCARRIKRE
jgi:hypothetical protein